MTIIPKLYFIAAVILLFIFPSISFSAVLSGDLVSFYPSVWEVRGIGSAKWMDKGLIVYADGIIVDLITGNLVAFGNVIVERDGNKERYDIFYTKELIVKSHGEAVNPYILAKEVEIDWKSTTITLKDVRITSDITLPRLSFPFGPYSSGVDFSLSEEIISIDTSTPYISIVVPNNGGIFTQILTKSGMEVFYEKEDYYLLGARTYMDTEPSLFGEYTLYSSDKSLSFTAGYDEIFYNTLKKEVRNGLWLYTGMVEVNWESSPGLTLSLSATNWDRLSLKGEVYIDTSTGKIDFSPYIGYRFDISKDLNLDIALSKTGIESLKVVYKIQPAVNLKVGYINPQKYVIGVEWGYRGIDLVSYDGILSLILK